MANGLRVLLRAIMESTPAGDKLVGFTLGMESFGKGPGKIKKGEKKPAVVTLLGAFLKNARDEKSTLKFEPFATLSGTLELAGASNQPRFTLGSTKDFTYLKPEPKTPTFRRIQAKFDAQVFTDAPPLVPPGPVDPKKLPPDPPALYSLRLPEEPAKHRFLVVAAELEIDGAKESDTTQNDMLDVPLPPIRLKITKHDAHFAPSKEKLTIRYLVGGLEGATVHLEVSSKHYKDGPIYTRKLEPKELHSGTQTIEWDGKCNAEKGDLQDKFLNPLFGPYEIKIADKAHHETKVALNVLYHSLELTQGPWTADRKAPPQSSKKEWVQYRLNELGYFGGPVGHDFDDYLKKAVIRYKANDTGMHELIHSNYNDSLSAPLIAALSTGKNKRTFIEGDAIKDPKKSSKLFVEALTYERTSKTADEFGTAKAPKEKARLNRPLVPIEIKVFLKGKTNKKVDAPLAVGTVRINVVHKDEHENLTKQFSSTAGKPSQTKKYIEKALKVNGGRAANSGDNAHKDFAGIRDAAATDFETPFHLGKSYEPFELKKDAGQKVCFLQAHADEAKNKDWLGKGGFYFRPSYIAGDTYKLRAEIDFTGLPNQTDLEKAHKVTTPKKRIQRETGTIQIWRTAKVAVQLNWPARKNSNQWAQVREEFDKAYVDLDVSKIAASPITAFLSNADYQKVVTKHTSHKAKDVTLDPSALVGVALPAQGNMNAINYESAIDTFVNANYWDKIYQELSLVLSENIRKKHPVGFIIADFLTHVPVNIQKAPPANTTVVKANHVAWTFSIGLPDSIVFADQKDPDKVYYVVSHEMGHNFWLQHWENSGGVAADHDTKDHNCSMSYSTSPPPAHQAPGIYTPHFCGQCNLKLRGWDIDHASMPGSS